MIWRILSIFTWQKILKQKELLSVKYTLKRKPAFCSAPEVSKGQSVQSHRGNLEEKGMQQQMCRERKGDVTMEVDIGPMLGHEPKKVVACRSQKRQES